MRCQRLLATLWVSCLLSGCSAPPAPPPSALDGVVTMDGKPVPAAGVMIVAEGSKTPAAMGMTDPLGKFKILTRFGEDPTISPGTYKILVESPGPVAVPPLYKDINKTPLSVTLPHAGELEIVLKK